MLLVSDCKFILFIFLYKKLERKMSSSIKSLCAQTLSRLEEKLDNTFQHLQPHDNQEKQSYFNHFRQAIGLAKASFIASIVFTIHAFYPDVFVTTGTTMLKKELNLRKN